jgi:hypothetical protein
MIGFSCSVFASLAQDRPKILHIVSTVPAKRGMQATDTCHLFTYDERLSSVKNSTAVKY